MNRKSLCYFTGVPARTQNRKKKTKMIEARNYQHLWTIVAYNCRLSQIKQKKN